MAWINIPTLKKNSVPTTIASPGIGASDTTIPVTELSRFYDKNGDLIKSGIVIGFLNGDPTLAEEIAITGASGTSGAGNLTGATRGVNADGAIGAAAVWPADTEIAVMFSTGTFNTLKNDIELHESDIGTLSTEISGKLSNSGAANGKIYIGKADGTFALVTLTPGANVTITNADGAVTIAAKGGDFLVNQIFS